MHIYIIAELIADGTGEKEISYICLKDFLGKFLSGGRV